MTTASDSRRVTIVVTERERFGLTPASLDSLYDAAKAPYRVIFVTGGAPHAIREYLQRESVSRGFELICCDHFLTPNEARNLGLLRATGEYVVFTDNDVFYRPGWLEALVGCADETGASLVGPLYLEGDLDGRLEDHVVHMAGGSMRAGHDWAGYVLGQLPVRLRRKEVGYLEFHCMLARRDVFEKVGPLDERFKNIDEHEDLARSVHRIGGNIYWEPEAIIAYSAPPPCDWSDLAFYMLRWCDLWTLESGRRYIEKWGEPGLVQPDGVIPPWVQRHRALVRDSGVLPSSESRPVTPLENAQLIVATFMSFGREWFDLVLTDCTGQLVSSAGPLHARELLDRLPSLLRDVEEKQWSVSARSRTSLSSFTQPGKHIALIQLSGLTADDLPRIEPIAFLTLETPLGWHECWIALEYDKAAGTSVPAAFRNYVCLLFGMDFGEHGACPLAGTPMRSRDRAAVPTTRLRKAMCGHIASIAQLSGLREIGVESATLSFD